jgi:signal transduction histidine kinase
MNNLLYNSIKYSAPGTDINVKLLEHNQHIEIQISDEGMGIPYSDKNNIFE